MRGVLYCSTILLITFSFGEARAQKSPTAITGSATGITSTSATLNGTVNPNGSKTQAWFYWGTSTPLSNTVGAKDIESGTSAVALSFTLTGLTPGKTYYFQVWGQNSVGSVGGSVSSFTTQSGGSPPPPPALSSPANGQSNVSLSPTLQWNASSGATVYNFEYSTSNSFLSSYTVGTASTSYKISGLASNSIYYWRVNAENSSGTSGWSSVWSFTTQSSSGPPSPPTLASPGNGSTGVSTNPTLSWNAVPGATSYALQVASDQNFQTLLASNSGISGTQYTLSGVEKPALNSTYWWRVSASNSSGTSGWSTVWTFTTQSGGSAPSPPTANGATNVGSTSFTANWSSSAGATGYKLDVSTNNTFASYVGGYQNLDVSNTTSWNVSGLSSGVTYYYRVRAYNSSGTSGNSNTVSATTTNGTPSPPTLSSPSNGATDVSTSPTVSWNSVSGASSYNLQVSTNSSFTSLALEAVAISGTSYPVQGLANGTTYYWRVDAANSSSTSSWSSAWSFTTVIPPSGGNPPPSPTLSSPANGATNVSTTPTLSWNSSSGATTYNLQVATDQGFSNFLANQIGITATQFQLTGTEKPALGSTYYWRVSASNAGGTSGWSSVWSFTTGSSASLSPPTLSSPSNGATDVSTSPTVSWNSVSGATSYNLEVSTDNTFAFANLFLNAVAISGTSYQVQGLANGTTYYWRVDAANSSVTSSWSSTWSFATLNPPSGGNPPPPPTLSSPANGATNVSTSPTLSWNSSSGATAYSLQVATDQGFSHLLANESGITATQYTLTGVEKPALGSTYYWRVSASNTGGTSVWSSVWSFTTQSGGSAPSPPTANGATNVGSTSFTANWSSSAGATGYKLDVSTNNTFTSYVAGYQNLDVSTTTSWNVSGLSSGVTYYYRLRAYNASGTSGNSNIISVTTTNGTSHTFACNIDSIDSSTGYVRINGGDSWAPTIPFTFEWGDGTVSTGWFPQSHTYSVASGTYTVSVISHYASSGSDTAEVLVKFANPNGLAPIVTTLSASGITTKSANIATYVNPHRLTTTVYMQWGTTTAYGNTTTSDQIAGTTVGNLAFVLSGLTPTTTYHFRAVAINSLGTSYGADSTFTTQSSGSAPTVTTLSVNGTTTTSTNLTGSVNPNGLSTTVYFQWGTTMNYGNTTPATGTFGGTSSLDTSYFLSGLSAGTTYHYRAVASNSAGTNYGGDSTFTTKSGSGAAPTVATLSVNGTTTSSTNLTASVNPKGLSTTVYFQWGMTTNYGNTTPTTGTFSGTSSLDTSYFLTGLSAGTTYHYRAVASNSAGTSYGADSTFTTLSTSTGNYTIQEFPASRSVTIYSGGTPHVYLRILDSSGNPVQGVAVSAVWPNTALYSATSDSNGFADLTPGLILGSPGNATLTVTKIGNESLSASQAIPFVIHIVPTVSKKFWNNDEYVNIGFSAFSSNVDNGSDFGIIRSDGSDDSLDVKRQLRFGGGAGISAGIGVQAQVTANNVTEGGGFQANAGINGSINALLSDDYRFDFNHMSQDEATAEFLILSSGMIKYMTGPLVPIYASIYAATNPTVTDILNQSYQSSAEGVEMEGDASAQASFNLDLTSSSSSFNLNAGAMIGAQGTVDFCAGQYASGTRSLSVAISGGVNAGAYVSGSAAITLGSITLSRQTLNLLNWNFAPSGEIKIESFFDPSGNLQRIGVLAASSQPNGEKTVNYSIVGSGQSMTNLNTWLSLSGVPFLVGEAVSYNIGSATGMNLFGGLLDEVNLLQGQNSNIEVKYEVDSTIITPISNSSVSVGVEGGTNVISASFATGTTLAQDVPVVLERGIYYSGRYLPFVVYKPGIFPSIQATPQATLQAILNNLPPDPIQHAISEFTQAVQDGTELVCNFGQSTFTLAAGALQAGTNAGAAVWSWLSNNVPTAATPATLSPKMLAFRVNLKNTLQQVAHLQYGIGGFYQLLPQGQGLKQPSTLSIAYTPSEVAGLDQSKLAMYYWDQNSGTWKYFGGKVDTVTHTVTATIDTLFLYTLAPTMPQGPFDLIPSPDTTSINESSTVTVHSSMILNNDSSVVANGTLFTVSTTLGTISTPDADPDSAGIQVQAESGEISFQIIPPKVPGAAIIKATSLSGNASAQTTCYFTDNQAPPPPTGLAVKQDSAGVLLTWQPDTNVDLGGYRIYYGTHKGGPYNGTLVQDAASPFSVGNETERQLVGLSTDSTYYFRVTAYNLSGVESQLSSEVSITLTSVNSIGNNAPRTFMLLQNYPNPFNPSTTIDFALKENSSVTLAIFNLLGQRVRQFNLGRMSAGTYSQNVDMSRFASGVYFYRIEAVAADGETFIAIKKMMLLK